MSQSAKEIEISRAATPRIRHLGENRSTSASRAVAAGSHLERHGLARLSNKARPTLAARHEYHGAIWGNREEFGERSGPPRSRERKPEYRGVVKPDKVSRLETFLPDSSQPREVNQEHEDVFPNAARREVAIDGPWPWPSPPGLSPAHQPSLMAAVAVAVAVAVATVVAADTVAGDTAAAGYHGGGYHGGGYHGGGYNRGGYLLSLLWRWLLRRRLLRQRIRIRLRIFVPYYYYNNGYAYPNYGYDYSQGYVPQAYPSVVYAAPAQGRYLGIDEQPVADATGSGMQVVQVYAGTPAQQAGLQVGDVIYSANGYNTQAARQPGLDHLHSSTQRCSADDGANGPRRRHARVTATMP